MKAKSIFSASAALAVLLAAAPLSASAEDTLIYGTMNIPYTDFYAAELGDSAGEVDAVTSATKTRAMKTKRIAELGLLSAVMFIIFVIELRIPNPFPIPGVKLGLANIVTVYAVFRYKPQEMAMIVAVRIVLGAVFSGNPSALIYSAAGAFCYLIGMLPLLLVTGSLAGLFTGLTAQLLLRKMPEQK